ncbi:AAA family ATPase, partial [Cetobacterium sp.]|uniref:AAA family ATPase n=1 Tax=Cetobacterium sp. TaxID=2071632 RepID=UPI003EE4F6CB
MRIKKIEIDNFRAFDTKSESPFVLEIQEKPIVLIYGNNGLGKSSLYDAIEWGITGKIERYNKTSAEKNDYPILRNHFTDRKDGYVKITFDNNFEIQRKLKTSLAKTDYNCGELLNGLNQKNIINTLVNTNFQKKNEYLDNFNSAHLLSQELLNSFIKEKNQAERYKIFLTLYGLNQENDKKDMVDEKIKEVEEIKKRINLEIQNNKERFSKENIKLKSSSDSQERFYLEESLRQINPKINITIEVLKDINVNYLNQKNKDLILLEKLKRKKELIE